MAKKGLGYYIPPELKEFGKGAYELAKTIRPFQGQDLPIYDSDKSFGKNILDMATGIGTLGLDFATLGTASAPQKIALKIAEEAAKSGTKTGVRTVDEIIESGQVKKASKMTDDPLNVMSIKRDRRDSLRDAKSKKYSVNDVVKDATRPVNKVLLELGDERISKMTIDEGLDYIRNKGVNISRSTLAQKKLNFKPIRGEGSGSANDKLTQVLMSIKNPSQYTVDQLLDLPQVKKVVEENKITRNVFNTTKSNIGIKSKSATFIEKLGVNEKEMIDFLKENPNTTTTQLKVQFPKIKNVSIGTLDEWRQNSGSIRVPVNKKSILEKSNPKLQSQLDFVSQSGDKVLPSNVPIKHKEEFSEIITMNKKTGSLDTKRTIIVKAHGIGQGGISKASEEIIRSKVAMIPDKFLEEVKLPKFFLTRTGNDLHGDIEDNLILALIKKYKTLGYKFVDGSWKQTKKVNAKDVNKELRSLENEIAGYQKELNELDAYTLFYNPVKDKMVTHGKPLSEIPGLSNLLNKVQSGEKKLRYGGLVGISHLTRPL